MTLLPTTPRQGAAVETGGVAGMEALIRATGVAGHGPAGTPPGGLPSPAAATVAGRPLPGHVGGTARLDGALIERIRRLAASGVAPEDPVGLRAAVAAALRAESLALPAHGFAAAVQALADELTGLGPLAPLVADPAVTDVCVNGPDEVWVERHGRLERVALRLGSAAALHALIQRVVAPLGLRVDESRPWVDARLPGGERFHAVLPPLAPDGPLITIRTFARNRLSLADLVAGGSLDPGTALLLEAMVAAGVTTLIAGGTQVAWVTPLSAASPAKTGRRLVIQTTFVADGGRLRRLAERARALGFADLRGYLQARCDAGWSVPELAEELGTTDWRAGQTLAACGIQLASVAQRRAQTRRRASERRLAARVRELGFAGVKGYLRDRIVAGGWTLAEVEAELGAHRRTIRRLMVAYGIRRTRRTAAERAAAAAGHRAQRQSWAARRAARLAELGFDSLEGYVRARAGVGWSVKRMRAELGVGVAWLRQELARLGLAPPRSC